MDFGKNRENEAKIDSKGRKNGQKARDLRVPTERVSVNPRHPAR
jgi:hypothetical protein